LPDGRGVLASTLTKLVYKAQKSKPIAPSLIGAILGRGVLIDAKITGAYKTITSALEAIKKGEAPKASITAPPVPPPIKGSRATGLIAASKNALFCFWSTVDIFYPLIS
jgi:hypothetical protein